MLPIVSVDASGRIGRAAVERSIHYPQRQLFYYCITIINFRSPFQRPAEQSDAVAGSSCLCFEIFQDAAYSAATNRSSRQYGTMGDRRNCLQRCKPSSSSRLRIKIYL